MACMICSRARSCSPESLMWKLCELRHVEFSLPSLTCATTELVASSHVPGVSDSSKSAQSETSKKYKCGAKSWGNIDIFSYAWQVSKVHHSWLGRQLSPSRKWGQLKWLNCKRRSKYIVVHWYSTNLRHSAQRNVVHCETAHGLWISMWSLVIRD